MVDPGDYVIEEDYRTAYQGQERDEIVRDGGI